jgi:VWFA-related protein
VDVVTKAYADASAAVHFLHIARPTERPAGIRMEEQSEDVFAPFQEMARATGGFAASTANIAAAMREAVEASENYYLLYYTPAGYKADGRFRHITVKVKAGGAKVSHRLGYIAD